MQSREPIFARNMPPALLWLAGTMAVIELVLAASDFGLLPGNLRAIAFTLGAFWDPLTTGTMQPVFPGQPFTMFITHAFLHAGFFHLVMNTAILLALGRMIAAQAGAGAMLLLFFICAIGGGIAFAWLSETQIPAIGASGAVFGFLGLWQYWEAMIRRARNQSLRPVIGTVFALVLINVLLALYMQGLLAWQAHLGGFVAGVAMGPVMTNYARRRGSRRV